MAAVMVANVSCSQIGVCLGLWLSITGYIYRQFRRREEFRQKDNEKRRRSWLLRWKMVEALTAVFQGITSGAMALLPGIALVYAHIPVNSLEENTATEFARAMLLVSVGLSATAA